MKTKIKIKIKMKQSLSAIFLFLCASAAPGLFVSESRGDGKESHGEMGAADAELLRIKTTMWAHLERMEAPKGTEDALSALKAAMRTLDVVRGEERGSAIVETIGSNSIAVNLVEWRNVSSYEQKDLFIRQVAVLAHVEGKDLDLILRSK